MIPNQCDAPKRDGASHEMGYATMQFISLKGARIPALGFGTYPLSGESGRRAIAEAIGVGYRHIDTAQMYGNESDVGAAIRASKVDRAELFVTTKIDNGNHAAGSVRRSVEDSLRALGTGYVDLLLIHWPMRPATHGETLAAMAKLKDEGKVRHLGVSNFNVKLLGDAIDKLGADLLCDQVEYHPYLSQRAVLAEVTRRGMMLTAYCPIAHGKVARDPAILAVAKRLGKTPTQVTLRWLIEQRNVAAIPKAGSRQHMIENISIFDFALTDSDRRAIDKLGSPSGRIVDPGGWAPAWDRA
jgi:2,5-diketo-D-gluconate reductase B